MNGRARCVAPVQPVHRRGLWVAIHHSGHRAFERVKAGQIGGERGFAAAALGVQDDDPVQFVRVRRNKHTIGAGLSQ